MLKLAIIVDSLYVDRFTFNIINEINEASGLLLEHVIVQKINHKKELWRGFNLKNINEGIKNLLFFFIYRFERHFILRNKELKDKYFRKYDISDKFKEVISVTPLLSKSKKVHRFSSYDIEVIKSFKFDLILRAGSGILRGEILTSSKNGIISFHHGDHMKFRGGPFAYWEVYHRVPQSSFIIQILNNELDGGKVIARGSLDTAPYYTLNMINILEKSYKYLVPAILDSVITENQLNQNSIRIFDSKIYKTPGVFQQIIYLFKLIRYLTDIIFRKILGTKELWEVCYQLIDDWKEANLSKFLVIKNPKGSFLADPFILHRNDKNFVFVEEYSYTKNKGKIVAYEVNHIEAKYLGVALEENFHLSFPFIFEYDGETYMIPETHQINEIRLYKCEDFPLKWTLAKTLIEGINAVDTILLFMNDYFWLITSYRDNPRLDFNSDMKVYYSKELFSTNWVEVNLKPGETEIYSVRNGGLLKQGDEYYRISQIQGFNLYGYALSINKILAINKNEFREKSEKVILPNFSNNIKGIHTINVSMNAVVYDRLRFGRK